MWRGRTCTSKGSRYWSRTWSSLFYKSWCKQSWHASSCTSRASCRRPRSSARWLQFWGQWGWGSIITCGWRRRARSSCSCPSSRTMSWRTIIKIQKVCMRLTFLNAALSTDSSSTSKTSTRWWPVTWSSCRRLSTWRRPLSTLRWNKQQLTISTLVTR